MKDWEKELTKKYKGKDITKLPMEIKHDENYGHFFSYYNDYYVIIIDDSTGKIDKVKKLKFKRIYK